MAFARDDLSTKLIHLAHGAWPEAFDTLVRILSEGRLRGTDSLINDGIRCVCFNEAPITKISLFLSEPPSGFRYAPFGVMVDKTWLYLRGGRPVIYQAEHEYALLPEALRHRHKRYEPDKGIDFTWEREWRLRADALPLDPDDTTVIVPTRRWEARLAERLNGHLWPKRIALDDLGIPFEDERLDASAPGEAL